jgi:MFS family permease
MSADETSPAASLPVFARPTRVRYLVLGFLCSLSVVLYLDRLCMSMAGPPIQSELKLSNTVMGFVHGAFLLAYGLFEVPTGWWGDRHGSRGVLLRIVLWWSAFTALTGAATGLAMLLVVRFLFGAGEAGALPNAARVVSRWFPPGGRGPAQGSISTAALLGGVLAPPVTQQLMIQIGWRWTFVVFGAVGVLWAVVFYLWFRDDPAEHPAVNEAERRLISGGEFNSRPVESHPPVPWMRVLSSPNLWLLGGVISCSAFASYLYFSWYPKYLQAARGVSETDSSWLTSLVLMGGAVGCVFGGQLNDWLVRCTGNRRWTRRAVASGGLACAGLALLASIHTDWALGAALWTTLASFTAGIALTTWWAVVTDVAGKHLGALFGLMNSLGVVGGFASQVFFGQMADWMGDLGHRGRDQWDPAFYGYTLVLLTGAFGWLFVDGTRSIVEPAKGAGGTAT